MITICPDVTGAGRVTASGGAAQNNDHRARLRARRQHPACRGPPTLCTGKRLTLMRLSLATSRDFYIVIADVSMLH